MKIGILGMFWLIFAYLTLVTGLQPWCVCLCLSRLHGREAEDGDFGAGETGGCSGRSGRLPGPSSPADHHRRWSAGEQRAAVFGGDLRWHHAGPPCSSRTQRFRVRMWLRWFLFSFHSTLSSLMLTLCVTLVSAGPSCEAATTCAATASFPSPEAERGAAPSAPSWMRFECSPTRQVRTVFYFSFYLEKKERGVACTF